VATILNPAESPDRVSPVRFVLRAVWIAIRLLLVFYLGQPGLRFFYQNF
jgi:hypothetical protein